MKNKRFFPMFVDLSDKKIVVVGGGNIATRRIKTLLQFTRNITAVAPKTTMELHELGKAGFVNLINRPVKRSDFTMAFSPGSSSLRSICLNPLRLSYRAVLDIRNDSPLNKAAG